MKDCRVIRSRTRPTQTDLADQLRQRTAELRASENCFQLLVEGSTDCAIFVVDPPGYVRSWNGGAARIHGCRSDEILGQHSSQFYPEEERRADRPGQELRAAGAEGRSEHVGWRVRKDGSRFWASVITTALRDDAGNLTGFAQVIHDLTEHRRSEKWLQPVVETAPAGLLMVDQEGAICLANAQLRATFGYGADELIGKPVEFLVPGSLKQQHVAERTAYAVTPLARGPGHRRTLFGRRKDGSQFPVEIGLQPISTDEGSFVLASVTDVSERRRAQKELQTSEEWSRSILNAISAHIAVLDSSGSILAVNSAWERFSLLNREDTPGRLGVGANYLDVCRRAVRDGDEYAARVLEGLQSVLDGSLQEFSYEYPCHSPREKRWFLLHAVPLSTESGGAVVSHTSITELKQAGEALQHAHDQLEQKVLQRTAQLAEVNESLRREVHVRRTAEAELRASEERYRAVVQDQTEVVSRFRADGTFVFVNDVYCRTFGKSSAELLGQRWVPVAHPDDLPLVTAKLATLSPDCPVVRIENRVFDADGRVRWMEFVNRGFFNPGGKLLEIQSVGRDVTDRAMAQEHLRISEERMRLAMDAAQISTWDLDTRTGEVVWSDNLETYMGMAPGTFGNTIDAFMTLVHPDDRPRVTDALDEAIRQHTRYEVEFRMVRPDGQVRWAATKGQAIRDTHQRVVRMVGVDVDITKHKQAEETMRRALRERETLLKEIHHRVKNNLQVIDSLLYLQSQYAPDASSVEMFQESRQRVRSMALVHERLYEAPDLTQVDFADYIADLANYLFHSYGVDTDRIRLECKVHRVRLSLEAAVPCGLLVNELISNCLKHAFRGREHGRILVGLTQQSKAEVLLSVSDDGVGLPPDVDPENARTFGMQLVQALTDQLHGRLEVCHESGTVVRVIFPWTSQSGD